MKNRRCPNRLCCFGYECGGCETCGAGNLILKLHKRIDRLKKQNETLTIQRNAWALTAKALSNPWISAEKQSPEVYRDESGELIPFLVCCKNTTYPFRAVYDGTNWGDGIGKLRVTHWMPLPEAPKMKGGEQE